MSRISVWMMISSLRRKHLRQAVEFGSWIQAVDEIFTRTISLMCEDPNWPEGVLYHLKSKCQS